MYVGRPVHIYSYNLVVIGSRHGHYVRYSTFKVTSKKIHIAYSNNNQFQCLDFGECSPLSSLSDIHLLGYIVKPK